MPSPTPKRRTFLTLPPELRLEIYTHLPIFTLLQLSHTNSLLRFEINRSRSIIRSSEGCWFQPIDHHNRHLAERPEYRRDRRTVLRSLSLLKSRPKGHAICSINLVRGLGCTEENELYKSMYPQEHVEVGSGRRACMVCFTLAAGGGPWGEGLTWKSREYLCLDCKEDGCIRRRPGFMEAYNRARQASLAMIHLSD
ncbi:hypothetical protein BJ508DRAFT_362033 [Ascobolus immersus RN42]|uniref:F-box domain-containing protein n=1 Tax=Ascobolus immersus RN42 TaxID=1160509 RepID=A0A3N4IAK2_ASCIM|nr:hypothetical protein BJ508DRAFT_362033 [Ascobolus immersus RN42]